MTTIFALASGVGAFLAMLGASIQLGLDLGERQGYMHAARGLDKAGTGAAQERSLGLGYKYQGNIKWIPKGVHEWLESGSPKMAGWAAVVFGAYFLYVGSLHPLYGSGSKSRIVITFAILAIPLILTLLAQSTVTAGGARIGRERAERDWTSAHNGKPIPDYPGRKDSLCLEWLHDFIFYGRRPSERLHHS